MVVKFSCIFLLKLAKASRQTKFSVSEINGKKPELPLLRYHFNCCRHPWVKTESPKFVCGNVADPKRSKNHLATLQESLKLPLIRHNNYHVIYGIWNAARVILFSSSSLNGSRVV